MAVVSVKYFVETPPREFYHDLDFKVADCSIATAFRFGEQDYRKRLAGRILS